MLGIIMIVLFSFQIIAQEKVMFECNDLEINVLNSQDGKRNRFGENDFFRKYNDVQSDISILKVERKSLYYQIKCWSEQRTVLKVQEIRIVIADQEKRNYLICSDKTFLLAKAQLSFMPPDSVQVLSGAEWLMQVKEALNNDARVVVFLTAELQFKKNKKIVFNNN